MSRIELSRVGFTPFQRLLGHNVDIMNKWSDLGDELEKTLSLSTQLKEEVRRVLAEKNGCAYCKAKGAPNWKQQDEKTMLAIAFTDVFLKEKESVPDTAFVVLKEAFNDKEISELCAFICFTTASQYYGAMLDLQP
ncbi:carboxymuconolactone decarboxylase family protein [Bacillus sp. 1780r2a1]|uniref:carboxymuconolactone decarboxylase family protein n=1 Tax=Priestia TaxID=2800373 RepID=UPI002202AE3A|nr:carboxymuconolactone decarboxylase family protein [Bacillus sp. 1780r2a1]